MLRDHVDMLYEVSADALDSLSGATNTQLFTFTRHYQQILVFNAQASAFRDTNVRRALNFAVNRDEVVREALNGHAISSYGPVSPNHWAFRQDLPHFEFDPQLATNLLAKHPKFRFVCLVGPESDRMALVLKRQLEAIGIDMEIREVPVDQFLQAFSRGDFEAVLSEFISGPALFRLYRLWHSAGPQRGYVGNGRFDTALDHIRDAKNDDEYRAAVAGLQQAALDDPPAIFIAWGERARAVNRRFEVATERDQDILSTLRLWRPTNDLKFVGRN
jgi:peptide/nickel transport system substrate-binding protein